MSPGANVGAVTGAGMKVAGVGRAYLWQGGSLFIGRNAGLTDVHFHHAIQITAADGAVLFRAGEKGAWKPYRGVMIPTHQPHAFDGQDRAVAHIFVEPESAEGRAIVERHRLEEISAIPPEELERIVRPLFATWDERPVDDRMIAAAKAAIAVLSGGIQPQATVDERIARAIDFIRRHLHEPITLEQVAAEVFLSPSRFRHLFVQETGMALRTYLLWMRFMRVWELVMAGESFTMAAHRAGFADSAHLTRTSRRMFGIAPTAIQVEDAARR
jgi:AraC-like DNA-binding protein